ncbi:MAG: YlxM family DNA-binding protein [Bacillota bacterium]
MLEQLNRINLLYDIYGPLLTERQQEAMRLYYSENYSLAEIAEEYNTSRQAVYDLIQRALEAIDDFEDKLGLYELFNYQQELLIEASELLAKKELTAQDKSRLKEIIAGLRKSNEQ